LPIQASLKINAPGDRYEREADRVADQVMRMPAPQVQRKTCSCGRPVGPDGMCKECKRKKLGIQRMAPGEAPQTSAPPIVHQVLQQPGRPLDSATRNFMESRFGQGLGGVRVHADAKAAKSADAVNAWAYTVGQDVVFGNSHYQPQTLPGRELLAHELTHVAQQRGSLIPTLQREENVENCSEGKKQVKVDLLNFRGSNRDPYSDLAHANTIFAQCCVEFVPGIGKSVDPDYSDPLMGNDATFERARCRTISGEEQSLIPAVTNTFGLHSRLRAFYFENINPSARATSHPEYCSDSLTLNHIYMTNRAADRTLAHEIGHILLNGYFHELPADNLMHPSNSATGSNLTSEQCETIRNNI